MEKQRFLKLFMLLSLAWFVSFVVKSNNYNGLTVSTSGGGFVIVQDGKSANILYDSNEDEVVGIAAECLSSDIELLSSVRPDVVNEQTEYSSIVIGTIGHSHYIDDMVAKGLITDEEVKGKWETFCLTTIEWNKKPTLVIYGSDSRGTAFGVFELSRAMGVTPYVWWADVVPEQKNDIYVTTLGKVVGPPSVKYRGMFINDEDWGLQPWAAKKMDVGVGDIGSNTYERVCELLLRLKANYLWPAMHPCTKAFWYYKENPEVARRYAIVLGSSHCEPLLRNNVDEWQNNFQSEYGYAPGDWNWRTNSSNIRKYWTSRVAESAQNDAIYTIGMRGIHDSSMPGYSSNTEKQKALKEVIGVQREIIQQELGHPASEVPQVFCPYKEALTLYRMGLDLPDDVTLLWADDNFGYIRQLSNPSEQLRSGGGGVYYHFSYWGVPCDHLWLSSVSPTLASYELRKAYDLNCKTVWVFNVGDIKPQELEFQFAMDYAWDVEQWSPHKAHSYTKVWAEEYFGNELADEIAIIKNEYYRLAAAGKPEHIHIINYSQQQMEQRLNDYMRLEKQVETLRGRIPERLNDAFFQLVYYPTLAASLINQKVLYAKLSYIVANEGKQKLIAEYGNRAMKAYERIVSLTREYNTKNANGKWDGIMDYAPRGLSHFYEPTVQKVSNVNMNPIVPTVTSEVITISAHNYISSGNSNKIQVINGLGISDYGVTILPLEFTAYSNNDITSAPYVEYDIPVGIGSNLISIRCLPTFPLYSEYRLRLATSIAGNDLEFHDLTIEAEANPWNTYVVNGYSETSVNYESAVEGNVKLRIYFADPGLVLSEIEITKPISSTLETGLVNPGFEYKSEGVFNNGNTTRGDPWGWSRTGTLIGNSYGISSDASGYEGKSICWYNSTPMPDEFVLYQSLSGLESGDYIVRCRLGVFTDQVTNQRLFANNSVQYYGKESDYDKNIVDGEERTFANHAFGVKNGSKGQLNEMWVKVTLNEGEDLTVGIRSSNLLKNGSRASNNEGWFKVDDFRIERAEEEVTIEPDLFDNTYTNKILNPGFELIEADIPYVSGTHRGDPYGWNRIGTLQGDSWGINNDGQGLEDNALCWYNANKGCFPNEFELSQVVSSLPYGHYTMTAKLACFSGKLTNQRVFANRYATYYGRETDYLLNLVTGELPMFAGNTPSSASILKPVTFDFYLFPDETLTLGVRSSNMIMDGTRVIGTDNAGWFKVDDFKLTYHGAEISDFISHVENLRIEAKNLLDKRMSSDVFGVLNAAYQASETINLESSLIEIQQVTNNLIDAISASRLSINLYALINDIVRRTDSKVFLLNSYNVEEYESVLAPIRDTIEKGVLDASFNYSEVIHDAYIRAVKSQDMSGSDMTEALTSDASSLENWETKGGNTIKINTWSTEGNSDGSNMRTPFLEDWVNSSTLTPLSDATIMSTIDGLHAGVYKLTALVRAYREYLGEGDLDGAKLCLGNHAVDVTIGNECVFGNKKGVFGTYSVETTLTENGSLTYGISVKDANFNWLAVKNFVLTYMGGVGTSIIENDNTNIQALDDVKVLPQEGGIRVISSVECHLPVYVLNGTLFKMVDIQVGVQNIALPHGHYVVNGKVLLVK